MTVSAWLRRQVGAIQKRPVRTDVPVSRLGYAEPGNQWYPPVVTGPSSLARQVQGSDAVGRAMAVLERLDCDEYHRFVMNFYRAGLGAMGAHWAHADLYTTLSGIAAVLQPRQYLEIGVRRGHSMAMVLAQAPACRPVGFDLWIEGYAGLENPGKDFVRQQLSRIGYAGDVTFVDGDSARTVPAFFREHDDAFFDLVTVDGDHSAAGAARDLENVLPRISIGGVVVFDDICNPSHPELADVWRDVVGSRADFATWTFDEAGFGVAFGIRTR
jgi:predicted O-methyltransferase YrrM